MALPEILTFVFTDIEHSTKLAQQLRENYPELLEKYRSKIRSAIQKHDGREIDTAGDGFFMTFKNSGNAILATAEIQKKIHSENWATSVGLKVRMSIHTGQAFPTKSGFTGEEIHYASRICDAAHGGQVLISQATQQALDNGINGNLTLSKLGKFQLKDFSLPIELFQLNVPGIKQRFTYPRINPDEKKIVVLPFTNQSDNRQYEYIGDGIAEEIIFALDKVPGLRVISRASAFAINRDKHDPIEIGKKFKVNAVLEGRINAFDRKIKVAVELIDAVTGLNIWSEQYDSEKEGLIYIQDEITRKVSQTLEYELLPEQMNSIKFRQTQNAEAYDFYLRGRRFYYQFSSHGVQLALKMFEKAIEADSDYALAYAGMSDCYSYQYMHVKRSKGILARADEASKKAVELTPFLAEVYVSRGIVMTLQQQYEEAENSFEYAVELNPTLFLGWFHYARTCFFTGKLDKAARLFEQANRVEPDDYQSILLAAQAYDSIECYDLSTTLRLRGVEIAEKFLELNPGDTRALYFAANALVFLDQKEKSLILLQRALTLEPEDSMLLYNAGCVYSLLGMKSEALSCLEKSYRAGLTLLGWYENDSNLDSLRDDIRFTELLEGIKSMSK